MPARPHLAEPTDEIRILAEYNIKELLRLNDSVLELNRDMPPPSSRLAQANLRSAAQ